MDLFEIKLRTEKKKEKDKSKIVTSVMWRGREKINKQRMDKTVVTTERGSQESWVTSVRSSKKELASQD